MSNWTATVFCCMLWFGAAARGIHAAEEIQTPPGWNTVMGTKGTAYDAAMRIFPGATKDKEENLVLTQEKVLRMPGTSKQRATLSEGTKLSFPESLDLRSEGKKFKVLLWEGICPEACDGGGFGNWVAVLAVFPEGSIEPIDVAEVKQDRETSLGDVVNLGAEDGFTLLNTHHNSNQAYAITDLFHLREGRLRHIASVSTLSSNCCCGDSFDEQLNWRVEPDGANPPRIISRVDLTHAPKGFTDDCDRRPKSRVESFEDRYRWDTAKKRYLLERSHSGRLDQWNERNY